MTTLLVDLGGTRLKSGLLPETGHRPVEVCGTSHHGRWLDALRRVVAQHRPDEVALCVPGVVTDGVVTALPGKLDGLVGADLGALLDVPVRLLVNDAIAYGVGEAVCGAGRGASRVVVVTLGTGVGVAVVEDGVPLGRGPRGGGLLGGQLVLGDGRTFEEQACAAALEACTGTDLPDAYDRLLRGDEEMAERFAAYRVGLVRGLTALCLAHAPDAVVVGGGAAQLGLLTGVEEAVRAGLWPGQSVVAHLAEGGAGSALAGLGVLLRATVPA